MSEEPRHRAKRRILPALLIVPAVVIALGVGAFILLTGGDSSSKEPPVKPPETVPAFSFKVGDVQAVPTNDTDAKKLQSPAESVAKTIGRTLSDMYRWAFLAQDNWQSGSYDQVWNYFDGQAAVDAQKDVGTLTLGTSAGDAFDEVAPGKGTMDVRVLMDEHGKPATAVASVKFGAKATGKDGTETGVVSEGQYFLQPSGNGWGVVAFRVSRNDRERKPKPIPTASATASGGSP